MIPRWRPPPLTPTDTRTARPSTRGSHTMPVCGRVVAAVAALTETGADRSTPCPEWTVCQLAQHLLCTARHFHRRAAGQDYYPAHAEVLRQAWDSSVPHLRIDLTGDPWAAVLSSAGRSVPQVVVDPVAPSVVPHDE